MLEPECSQCHGYHATHERYTSLLKQAFNKQILDCGVKVSRSQYAKLESLGDPDELTEEEAEAWLAVPWHDPLLLAYTPTTLIFLPGSVVTMPLYAGDDAYNKCGIGAINHELGLKGVVLKSYLYHTKDASESNEDAITIVRLDCDNTHWNVWASDLRLLSNGGEFEPPSVPPPPTIAELKTLLTKTEAAMAEAIAPVLGFSPLNLRPLMRGVLRVIAHEKGRLSAWPADDIEEAYLNEISETLKCSHCDGAGCTMCGGRGKITQLKPTAHRLFYEADRLSESPST
jgi:hypothetical protein